MPQAKVKVEQVTDSIYKIKFTPDERLKEGVSSVELTATLGSNGVVTYESSRVVTGLEMWSAGYTGLLPAIGLPEASFTVGWSTTADTKLGKIVLQDAFSKAAGGTPVPIVPPSPKKSGTTAGTPQVTGAPSPAPDGSTGSNVPAADNSTTESTPLTQAIPKSSNPNTGAVITPLEGKVIRVGYGDSAHDEVAIKGTVYDRNLGDDSRSTSAGYYVNKDIHDGLTSFAKSDELNNFEFRPKGSKDTVKMSDVIKNPDKYGMADYVYEGKFVFKYNSTTGGHGDSNSEHNYGLAADVTAFIGKGALHTKMAPEDYERFVQATQAHMQRVTGKEFLFQREDLGSNGSYGFSKSGIHRHIEVVQAHPRGSDGKLLSPAQLSRARIQMYENGFKDSITELAGAGGKEYIRRGVAASVGGGVYGPGAGMGAIVDGKPITNSKGQLQVIGAATKPFDGSAIIDIKNMPESDQGIKDLENEYSSEGGLISKIENEKFKKNAYDGHPGAYGIERKIDMPAHIQIRPDIGHKSGSDDMYSKYQQANIQYIDCFILRSVRSRKEEKSHIFSSLGDEVIAFFFGKTPVIYSFAGTVLDSKNQRWMDDFNFYYDRFLRGSAATKNKTRIYIVFTDQLIEGYLLNMSMDKSSDVDTISNITFDFLVTNSVVIGGYKDPLERKGVKSASASSKRTTASSGLPESADFNKKLNDKLLDDVMGNSKQMRMPWGMLGVPADVMKGVDLNKMTEKITNTPLSKVKADKTKAEPKPVSAGSAIQTASDKGKVPSKVVSGSTTLYSDGTQQRQAAPENKTTAMNAGTEIKKDPTVKNTIDAQIPLRLPENLPRLSPADITANQQKVIENKVKSTQSIPNTSAEEQALKIAEENYKKIALETKAGASDSATASEALAKEKAAYEAFRQAMANLESAKRINATLPTTATVKVAGPGTKEQIRIQKKQ